MSVKDRLIQYIEYKKISKRKFEQSIGVSGGFISCMRVSIQPDKVQRIALNYPDLNTGWLLTGEGEMLRQEKQAQQSADTEPLLAIIREKDRRIEELVRENAELRLLLRQSGMQMPQVVFGEKGSRCADR